MLQWTTLNKDLAEDSLVGLSIDEVAGGGLNLRQPPFLLNLRCLAMMGYIIERKPKVIVMANKAGTSFGRGAGRWKGLAAILGGERIFKMIGSSNCRLISECPCVYPSPTLPKTGEGVAQPRQFAFWELAARVPSLIRGGLGWGCISFSGICA